LIVDLGNKDKLRDKLEHGFAVNLMGVFEHQLLLKLMKKLNRM
jgi:hypothetical protein